jgi:hypothetical protein
VKTLHLRFPPLLRAAELSQLSNNCPFVAKSMIYQRGGLPNVRSFGHAWSAELVKGSRHVQPIKSRPPKPRKISSGPRDKKAARISGGSFSVSGDHLTRLMPARR